MDYTGLSENLADLQRRTEQLIVSLPNLRCTRILPAFGTNLVISAEVENNGTKPTTHACWARLVLTSNRRGQPAPYKLGKISTYRTPARWPESDNYLPGDCGRTGE